MRVASSTSASTFATLGLSCRFAVLSVILWSCGTLSISSDPSGADVTITVAGKATKSSLGKTPLKMDLSENEAIVNEGTVIAVVEKEGFETQRFVIPNISGEVLEISAILQKAKVANYQDLNRVVEAVLQAERLIMEKRLDEALKKVEEIKAVNQHVAGAYDIEGSVHFLKNDFEKSRYAWLRSLEINPENPEAEKMLSLVEKKLGISSEKKAEASKAGQKP